jgi:gelsolin
VGSLNDGDVFLLDLGAQVIQWNGIKSGMFEKRKAVEIIAALREDRNGRVAVTVMDGLEDNTTFWTTLGTDGSVPAASDLGEITADEEKKYDGPKRLYKLSDSSGQLEMTLVGEGKGKILKSKLDMTDVFILDIGTNIFVWIGKKASKQERANGIKYGVSYLQQQGRPADTPVQRIVQDGEPKNFFPNFDG